MGKRKEKLTSDIGWSTSDTICVRGLDLPNEILGHMNLGDVENIPGIHSADYIIITGDITNFGFRNDAEKVINTLMAINGNLLGVAGNLDQPDVARYLEDIGLSLHGKGRIIDGVGIVGLGGSNYTMLCTI